MSKVYSIANQKGGVGKTTTTLNLGAALKELGKRVLLVDMDPQGSLTTCLGLVPDELETTVYNVLLANIQGEGASPTLAEVVTKTKSGLDLAPSNIELSQADMDLVREPLGVYALRDALTTVKDVYDYILIDCPPSLGILTTNALAASDEVLIPLQADWMALKGVSLLLKTITKIQKRANRGLSISGILLTMADTRTSHAREIISGTQQAFEGRIHVFSSVIKLSVRFKEAPITGSSVLDYASNTTAAQAYRDLAQEVVR
jgi:chromosome partitioning protein